MNKNKKIILIILLILLPLPILFILFNFAGLSYDFIIKQKDIPSYNKLNSIPEMPSICKKIEDKNARDFCYALINNNFSSLDSSACEDEFFSDNYDKEFCYCQYENSFDKKCQSTNVSVTNENFCKENPQEPLCLALTKNPYYCEKENELMDTAEKDNCYKNAAMKWRDPFLCDKMIYNKDSCYFYLAIEELKKREEK